MFSSFSGIPACLSQACLEKALFIQSCVWSQRKSAAHYCWIPILCFSWSAYPLGSAGLETGHCLIRFWDHSEGYITSRQWIISLVAMEIHDTFKLKSDIHHVCNVSCNGGLCVGLRTKCLEIFCKCLYNLRFEHIYREKSSCMLRLLQWHAAVFLFNWFFQKFLMNRSFSFISWDHRSCFYSL